MEWDDPVKYDEILMSTSTDGGITWGTPVATADARHRNRRPASGAAERNCGGADRDQCHVGVQFDDGGASWSAPVTIANIQFHADAGGIRSGPLPSAAVDGAGTVWTVWEDCRFPRQNCSTNDLVYSTSTDGVRWSAVTRVPIDDTSSTVDHFIPGIGIDPATSGPAAHVAIHYYYYSQSDCTVATCQLLVGYISSANGGSTWNAAGRADRADAAQLVAEFAEWVDGGRLHCDRVHQRRAARSVRGGLADFRKHFRRSNLYGAGTDRVRGRAAVLVGCGQAAAQTVGQDREGSTGERCGPAVAPASKR